MPQIHWESIIEYCQEAAARGKLVTALFTDERQTDLPGDYGGEPTIWPSHRDAIRHFAENPDAWELVRRGYEWRSFTLHDRIEGYRRKVENGSMPARDASVLINSCFAELKVVGARALKEKVEAEPEKAAEEDVAARLNRARVRAEADEPAKKTKDRVTKGQEMLPDGFQGKRKPIQ